MIYVGTCGFSYRDWVGTFYPSKTRPAEMLAYYARTFAAVEIDASYYGVPTRQTVATMVARTPQGFRFSFKAPQTVTHPPDPGTGRVHDDARALIAAIEPAAESGKLACVLTQFPNGFSPSPEREAYLESVVAALSSVPVVVEFRNRRWQRPETIARLQRLGAGYANVDMPRFEGLLAPSSDACGEIGYVRFHGRNAQTWWRGSSVTRYAYDYTAEELRPWADRVAEIEAQTRDTYAFFNNHASGRAAANAREFAALLDHRYGRRAAAFVAHVRPARRLQERLPGLEDR